MVLKAVRRDKALDRRLDAQASKALGRLGDTFKTLPKANHLKIARFIELSYQYSWHRICILGNIFHGEFDDT
jgi:hypothetical protein